MEAVLGLSRADPLQVSSIQDGEGILNGRAQGKRIFEHIVRHLDQLPSEVVLPLNFSGVQFLDISCADEIIGRLITRIRSGELGGKFILIQNADGTVEENIRAALDLRDPRLCCPLEDAGRTRIIGTISEELRETYELALRKGTMTTHDLHGQIAGLKLTAASNRLITLERMGLLYKVPADRGGRQFVYQAVG